MIRHWEPAVMQVIMYGSSMVIISEYGGWNEYIKVE
jgi:hypothetical protein